MVWISIDVEVHGVKDGEADVTNSVESNSNYIVHKVVSHTLVYYLPCLVFQTIIPSQSNLVILICTTSMLGQVLPQSRWMNSFTSARRHPQAEPVVAYPMNIEIKETKRRGCVRRF